MKYWSRIRINISVSEFKSVYEKKNLSICKKNLICRKRGKKNLKSFFFWKQKRKEKRPSRCEYKIQIDHKLRNASKSIGNISFGVSSNELNFSFNSPSCDIQRRSSSNHINHLFSHSRMWTYPNFFFPLHFYYCMSFLLTFCHKNVTV